MPEGECLTSRPPARATPEEERLSQMQAQIDQLLAERSVLDPVQVLTTTQSHFPTSISSVIPPKNFKMPAIPQYNGKTDPVAHVQTYRTWMSIDKADMSALYNVFPLTLIGPAQAWFRRLRAGTISSFKQLKEQFIAQFLRSRP